MKRQIIGIQLHHSVQLSDASRGAANMCAGLIGALRKTGDPEVEKLLDDAKALSQRISRMRGAADARLRAFWAEDPERFVRCRDGEEPWPDECVGGFVARCSCYDVCRICVHGASEADGWVHQCGPCPQHREAA